MEQLKSNKNIVAIDYLRAFVILLVLAFHSVFAYVAFLPTASKPFASQPYLWAGVPIIDKQRWSGFDLFFLFNNVYFMALMFFMAGLFVWSSLVRKGAWGYLRDRGRRLGVPFALMAGFLMPVAYYPAYRVTGADPSILAYGQQWLALDYWPSGPGWFIALLLGFDILAAALCKIAPAWGDALGRLSAKLSRNPVACFGVLVAISVIVYFPLRLAFGALHWSFFGPFAVETSRALLYAIYFAAGIAVGAYGIAHGLLARDGLLAQRWWVWLFAAVVFFGAYLASIPKQGAPIETPTFAMQAIRSLIFVCSCGASSFCLLAIFTRFVNTRRRLLDSLSANAYGMYVIHYVFVSWLQYAILDVALPAIAKGILVFVGTLLLSWAASATIGRQLGTA